MRAVFTGCYRVLRGLPHIAEKLFAMGATSWCVCDATRINARPSHAKYPSAACTVEICDVSDHEDVKALADRLESCRLIPS